MADNNLDGSTLREINGRSKRAWAATSINFPPELIEKVDQIAREFEMPRNTVVIYAVELMLASAPVQP
jgi:hypothetical protein